MVTRTGIEPAFTAWEAVVLPIYEPCVFVIIANIIGKIKGNLSCKMVRDMLKWGQKGVLRMKNWRQMAQDAANLLTVCLARAIDDAMSYSMGAGWFADFAATESDQTVITGCPRSVQDLDLQALLKLMRYRNQMATEVLTHYGFYGGMDAVTADAQRRQLDDVLDRLIHRMDSRNRVADIEAELSGRGTDRIYGQREIYQDILKLGHVFRGVQDDNGQSYYKKMQELSGKKRSWALTVVVGALVLAITALVLLLLNRPPVYQNDAPPVVQVGQVSIQMYRAEYDGDEIVVQCYVTNGTDIPATEIDIYAFRLLVDGEEIALADFGLMEGLEVAPGASEKRQFRFPADTVSDRDADLRKLQAKIKFTYK